MTLYCIVERLPVIQQPPSVLEALVGLEFEYRPERIAMILNGYPWLPAVNEAFLGAETEEVLKSLRELRRFSAASHWREFGLISPVMYIPRCCCREVTVA